MRSEWLGVMVCAPASTCERRRTGRRRVVSLLAAVTDLVFVPCPCLRCLARARLWVSACVISSSSSSDSLAPHHPLYHYYSLLLRLRSFRRVHRGAHQEPQRTSGCCSGARSSGVSVAGRIAVYRCCITPSTSAEAIKLWPYKMPTRASQIESKCLTRHLFCKYSDHFHNPIFPDRKYSPCGSVLAGTREAGKLSRRLVVEVGDARRRSDFAS